MTDFAIASTRAPIAHTLEPELQVAAPASRSFEPVNAQSALLDDDLEGQLSSPLGHRVEHLQAMTLSQRMVVLSDVSGFTETDHQAVANLLLASLSAQQTQDTQGKAREPERDVVSSRLTFDPTSMDKHVAVLMAAVAAMNLARQAGAELQGKFAVLARDASVAQGNSIMESGQAAMLASLGAAVMAGGVAVAGAAVSIKGHVDNHRNVKGNLQPAQQLDSEIASLKADLAQRQPQVGSGARHLDLESGGSAGLTDHKNSLHADELGVMESGMREKTARADNHRLRSQLEQDAIAKKMTVGQGLSSLAAVISQGVSAIVMLERYAAEQRGVIHGADAGLNKSVSDAAHQDGAEDTSAINKLLEALNSLLMARTGFIGHVAKA